MSLSIAKQLFIDPLPLQMKNIAYSGIPAVAGQSL